MTCPYCKEEILEGASKCKHCGSLIVTSGGGGKAQSISLKQLLFSFQGRISRSTFWVRFSLPYFVIIVFLSVVDGIFGTYDASAGLGMLSGLFALVGIWPNFAVLAKRAHDRNKSGWFALLMLIPIINIWPLIELGFIKGTVGENKFGRDPLIG